MSFTRAGGVLAGMQLDAPRERPTTPRPRAGLDVVSDGAGSTAAEPGTSAAAEGRRSTPATRFEDYGPPSRLDEQLLFRGYGLGWPGFEDER